MIINPGDFVVNNIASSMMIGSLNERREYASGKKREKARNSSLRELYPATTRPKHRLPPGPGASSL